MILFLVNYIASRDLDYQIRPRQLKLLLSGQDQEAQAIHEGQDQSNLERTTVDLVNQVRSSIPPN